MGLRNSPTLPPALFRIRERSTVYNADSDICAWRHLLEIFSLTTGFRVYALAP